MVEFATVLDQVARDAASPRGRDVAASLAAFLAASGFPIMRTHTGDVAAFQADVARKPAPDRAALMQAVSQARRDAKKLRALRRRFAWDLHPDRIGDDYAALLAELNAAIDGALRMLA